MKSLLTLIGASLDDRAQKQLGDDGIQYLEQGIWVSAEYQNFKTRFKKAHPRKVSGLGAFAISTNKLAGSIRNKRMVGLDFWTMDDRATKVEIEEGRCVRVTMSSTDQSKGWTGVVTYRFFLKHMDRFYSTFSSLSGIYKF